jgi:predicted ArsR family transcriptional regulator
MFLARLKFLNCAVFHFISLPFNPSMKADDAIRIKTLQDSGMCYRRISKQLGINANTIKSHCQLMAHKPLLPQKEKKYRGTTYIRSKTTMYKSKIIS